MSHRRGRRRQLAFARHQLRVSPRQFEAGLDAWRRFVGGEALPHDEITPETVRVLVWLAGEIKQRCDAAIDGGEYFERAHGAMKKTVALATGPDAKQRRAALSAAEGVVRRPLTGRGEKTRACAGWIELVEELPAPRSGVRVRKKAGPGRPGRAQGGARLTVGRERLLRGFVADHQRLPVSDAEFRGLAQLDGGSGTIESRVTQLRRLAKQLRLRLAR